MDARLFVVLLAEAAHQLLEHGAHGVVIHSGGREVDVRREKFFDQCAERVGLGEGGDLVAESVMPASSSIFLVSSTASLAGSRTASMRRSTHMGRVTSGDLPRLKRSRNTSSAMPQMKETILLWVD